MLSIPTHPTFFLLLAQCLQQIMKCEAVTFEIPFDNYTIGESWKERRMTQLSILSQQRFWLIGLFVGSTVLVLLLLILAILFTVMLRIKILARYRRLHNIITKSEVYMNKQQMGPVTEKKFFNKIGKSIEEVTNERDNYNRLAYQRGNQISISEVSKATTRSKPKKTSDKQKTGVAFDSHKSSKSKEKISEKSKGKTEMKKAMKEEDYEMLDYSELHTRNSVINPHIQTPQTKPTKSTETGTRTKTS